MSKTIKVALAGAGAFGIKHLDGIKNIDGVEVVSPPTWLIAWHCLKLML
jgi:predicted homoserine dehydrogenase-like protein